MVRSALCLIFFLATVTANNHHHGCPEYEECTENLKALKQEDWEYYREIQEAFYGTGNTINGKMLVMATVISNHRDIVPVNDTAMADAYSMFRMYTVTDWQRNQEERAADLLVHWEIGDHDEADREKVIEIIKRFVLDWDQLAAYVEEGCGSNVKHAMQKTLRVAMQADNFFHMSMTTPRSAMKKLAHCFIKHSARALNGDE